MEHDDNNTIDMILSKRAIAPAPRSDLAERIIHAAVSGITQPARRATLWGDLMSMFVLPHPSVMVAAGIILGLLVGVEAGDGLFSLQQDWTSFLDINEGGWL